MIAHFILGGREVSAPVIKENAATVWVMVEKPPTSKTVSYGRRSPHAKRRRPAMGRLAAIFGLGSMIGKPGSRVVETPAKSKIIKRHKIKHNVRIKK